MKRRKFLIAFFKTLISLAGSTIAMNNATPERKQPSNDILLFLCGDVMTGRGIDQIMPHPSEPRIHEPYVRDARDYVRLAEQVNGPIRRPVSFSYIWGDALKEFESLAPDIRIINLETSVTSSENYWKGKGINYRMHPKNISCITAAAVDCCTLANNHVLDWGYRGLEETIETLKHAKVKTVGAGRNVEKARAPVVFEIEGKGRVIVLSFGSVTSGVPWAWAASEEQPGVNLLEDFSVNSVQKIAKDVQSVKRDGDIVVASIHWGGNWGYDIPYHQQRFAHALIDQAGVDVVHGHSSHHVKAVEVYKQKPIIYGCGDFLNDYEGIGGHTRFRPDLTLMYFMSMNPKTGRLGRFEMTPMQLRRLRLNRAQAKDIRWLRDTLRREGRRFGTQVHIGDHGRLSLQWQQHTSGLQDAKI